MTIEQFKNNWQPPIDSYERVCFNLDLKELEQQIRTDAIDELLAMSKKAEYGFCTIDRLCEIYLEQLKEQDNEQYLCPGGYDKRTVSCDECEIPFCDYR